MKGRRRDGIIDVIPAEISNDIISKSLIDEWLCFMIFRRYCIPLHKKCRITIGDKRALQDIIFPQNSA
jgi:hypothetical protein